jgi:hypothetical protein
MVSSYKISRHQSSSVGISMASMVVSQFRSNDVSIVDTDTQNEFWLCFNGKQSHFEN